MFSALLRRNTLGLALCLLALPATAQDQRNAESRKGMVSSRSAIASDIGAAVMSSGGNAVDAAIATGFALAVTHPSAGNLGGGGFMLVHPGDGSPDVFLDYREKAPQASTEDMYVSGGSRKNHRYVGVPGTVRGLALAHALYGSKPWSELVLPAVKLAKRGFRVNAGLAMSLNKVLEKSENAEFKRVYGKRGHSPWENGDRLVLTDLASSLNRIATHGADGFYRGRTADLLVAEMQRGKGYVTHADLEAYQARVRDPIRFSYRDYEVLSAPPPSSGGITLAQMMQIVEPRELAKHGRWSKTSVHVMIEAMRRAYANRAMYLGDPDFNDMPEQLATKAFARKLGATIDLDKATRSDSLGPKLSLAEESRETTHFSVVDGKGMAVSNTYTLEAAYGSGVVVTGAGFLLNNEMGDFNPKPGVTDRKGHIGTAANLVRPGKRMLSSMTPSLVLKNGKAYLVVGSPGGRTIINTVFCVTLNVLEFGMDLRSAVDAARFDHEWFPERVRFTGAKDPRYAELVKALSAMGHRIKATKSQGDANCILIEDSGLIRGAADSKWGGASGVK